MNRIFISGDTHGTIDFAKLTIKHFPFQKDENYFKIAEQRINARTLFS